MLHDTLITETPRRGLSHGVNEAADSCHSERAERVEESPEVRSDAAGTAIVRPSGDLSTRSRTHSLKVTFGGGDPSTHSSDSFTRVDDPSVTLSERVPPSESKGPPKQGMVIWTGREYLPSGDSSTYSLDPLAPKEQTWSTSRE